MNLPIIGMGGIQNGEDAVEFLMAGATAVSVGTANFMNPTATVDTVEGIKDYMRKYDIKDVNELIGMAKKF